MWTKRKSAILSLICTRVLVGLFVVAAVVLPFMLSGGHYGTNREAGVIYVGMTKETVIALLICAYACFVPAMIALFSLDRLLRNIRKDMVFVGANVRCLRIISWCCFVVAAILLGGWPFITSTLIVVAAAAAFFGLLMRVVKNVIDAACEIKDENDYTI